MELTRTQRLLTSLRESIIDKPPYISGTLQLPDPYFSLFYKVAEDGVGVDGHTARFKHLVLARNLLLTFLSQTHRPRQSYS